MHLRVVGQKDPLLEFKHEAFALFDSLTLKMKVEIAHALFKFQMVVPEETQAEIRNEIEKKLDFRTNLSLMPEILEITQEG